VRGTRRPRDWASIEKNRWWGRPRRPPPSEHTAASHTPINPLHPSQLPFDRAAGASVLVAAGAGALGPAAADEELHAHGCT